MLKRGFSLTNTIFLGTKFSLSASYFTRNFDHETDRIKSLGRGEDSATTTDTKVVLFKGMLPWQVTLVQQ